MHLSIFNTLTESDPGLFIWMSAIFAFFGFSFYKAGYRPLMDSLGARNSEIQDALDEADKAKAEMQNLKAENDRLLAEAKAEAGKNISRGKDDKRNDSGRSKEKSTRRS